ncbi:MAG: sortase [Anaerolineales bacterium]|nr:sortase [Anaerolineales bacterium]
MKTMNRWLSGGMIFVLVVGLAFVPGGSVQAAGTISLATLGAAYAQDFDTLAITGTANAIDDLNNGWYLTETGGGARDNELYAAGTGSSNTGDTYSFGASGNTERALGGLLSGTLNPVFGASFTNNTGATITSLDVAYTGEMWRLGTADRTDRIDFQWSANATSLTSGAWTDFDSLDFSTPDSSGVVGARNGNSAAYQTAISATISGLSIASGATFWIRWTDTNASGADDGLAVDAFSLTPQSSGVVTLSIDDVSANEGDGGSTTFAFSVSLSSPAPAGGVTFDLATQDNTAQAPADYSAVSLTGQAIPAGSSTYAFHVTVLGDTTYENDETFFVNVTNVVGANPADAQGLGTILNDDVVPIHAVQGGGHLSPLVGNVVTIEGIVTALRTAGSTRGLYVQERDAAVDADPATSEGIFVFTGSTSNPALLAAVGDRVRVTGAVSEYRSGGGASASLTLTELVSPTVVVLSSGNPLPAATVIGAGGRLPPQAVIDDDATGSVELSGTFDPASDGIDFYESLEGMLVQVNHAVVVGRYTDFSSNHEIAVIGDNGASAGLRTGRGGVVIGDSYADFNPERILLNDWIAGGPTLPAVDVGDAFPGAIIGVIDYSFNNFKLQVISMPGPVDGGLAREVAAAPGPDELSVATFNVENLAPTDPASKFATLADLIVNHLQSPDILVVEEVQDNNGTLNDAIVAADLTWATLIAAIQAAGGPTYEYRQIDPVDDQDGGAPGGNIRVGFLFRTDRGLAFVDRPGAGSTTANAVVAGASGPALLFSPGRIHPTSTAFDASRKPLAAEFTFRGQTLFVIANHFNSKGGDDPLYGRYQPPVLYSETQRLLQAAEVRAFVQDILALDPNAYVIVAGDLNDFPFSPPLTLLESAPLHTLIETLPAAEQYTYVYEGNSQALDHTLLSAALFALPFEYDVVHVNSEFAVQASDHEPQVTRIRLDTAPTILFGANTVPANGAVLTAGPTQITVEFSKDVQAGGGPDAADAVVNYLLVAEAPRVGFQTSSCAVGMGVGDSGIAIQSASYAGGGAGPFIATLNINNGIPLPAGNYLLLVCGTTSVRDLFGSPLNGGADSAIPFRVSAGAAGDAGVLPATGFAPGVVTTLPEQSLAYATSDLRLEIPRLGLEMDIVGVPQVNGGWDVTWLNRDAGWLQGTAFPTWAGNSVITGHVWDAWNQPGPFVDLHTLWYGDRVVIHAWGQEYVYAVRSVRQVQPGDTAAITRHEDYPWLTLVTCKGFDPASNSYRYRVVVRAVQVEIR